MAERIAQADPLNQYHLQCLKDPNTPLLPFSGIVMSGGNTYRLRHVLRASGLDGVLAQAIRTGIPVYGVSAGATVLGADIDISVDKHPEYTACDGLDLVQGYSVLCHYGADRVEHLSEFQHRKHAPCLGIPDSTTVRFKGKQMLWLGEPLPSIVAR